MWRRNRKYITIEFKGENEEIEEEYRVEVTCDECGHDLCDATVGVSNRQKEITIEVKKCQNCAETEAQRLHDETEAMLEEIKSRIIENRL